MRPPRLPPILLIAVFAVGIAAVSGCFARTERIDLTHEEWRQDLEFIARELPRRHANAFHHVQKEQFEQAVAELHDRIPTLTGPEVATDLVRLVAMVGDLHTRLAMPKNFERLPIEVDWFEDELRVTAASADYRNLLGMQITAIENTSVQEADRTVRALIPQAENEWTFKALTPSFLVRPRVLHAMGLIETPDRVTLHIAATDAAPVEITVKNEGGEDPGRLVRLPTAPAHLLARPEESFWWTDLGQEKSVYIRFKTYEQVAIKSKQLALFLEERQPQQIIVDMRDNLGGDFTKVREHLIPVLEPHVTGAAPSRLFVIIGRRTLSAAMTNAIDLKTRVGAVLVGEPTGERPNSYQEGRQARLPNSGLRLSYSTRYYKFLVEDAPALMPDVEVRFDWTSYSEGRDPALEAIAARTE